MAGNTRRTAARYAAVAESTFFDWLRRYPEFSQAVEGAEAIAEMQAVSQIRLAARNGDARMALEWLRHHPGTRADWHPAAELDVRGVGPGGASAMLSRLESLDDDDLEQELHRLRVAKARRVARGAPPRVGDGEEAVEGEPLRLQ